MAYTYLDIAKMIDHSLLQQTLTDAELDAGCQLAEITRSPRYVSNPTMSPVVPKPSRGQAFCHPPRSAFRTAATSPASRWPSPFKR